MKHLFMFRGEMENFKCACSACADLKCGINKAYNFWDIMIHILSQCKVKKIVMESEMEFRRLDRCCHLMAILWKTEGILQWTYFYRSNSPYYMKLAIVVFLHHLHTGPSGFFCHYTVLEHLFFLQKSSFDTIICLLWVVYLTYWLLLPCIT